MRLTCLAAGLALTAATTGLAPATAQAQGDPRPGLLELIAPDRIAGLVANTGIAALRTVVEVEYDHLSTDVLRGQIALSGVTLRPALPYDRARQCVIEVDRLVIQSDMNLPVLEASAATITLVGARADAVCLPPEAQLPLRTAGFSTIEIDRLAAGLTYEYATGETLLDVSAAIQDLATLDLSAAGVVVPNINSRGRIDEPGVRVNRAVLSLRDTGGWDRLAALIPENLREPEAVRAVGTAGLTEALTENGTRTLTGVERNFIDDLMEEVARFVADPSEITIEADLPEEGIVIAAESFEKPQELIAGLALDVRSAPLARSELLDASLLARLNNEDLGNADRMTLARALLGGNGVPRTPRLVPGLLAPVVDAGGDDAAEAAILSAQGLASLDPDQAYRLALQAGELGAGGAVALLDRLEANMTTGAVMAAQEEFSRAIGAMPTSASQLPPGDDPRALRSRAIAFLTGIDASRNYALAYYNALLADGAGDVGAAVVLSEIEGRFANRGPDVAALWADVSVEIQAQALRDWVESDLASRYLSD